MYSLANKERNMDKLVKLRERYNRALSNANITLARRLRDQIIKLEFDLGITGG